MRITKAALKRAIASLRVRLSDLTAISELGGTRAELERQMPAYKDMPPQSEGRMLRVLMLEAIDKSIPPEWYQ